MPAYTIKYRGWEIDPVRDDDELGDWQPCSSNDAAYYMIFPPGDDTWMLDELPPRLSEALAIVDRYIEKEAAA